MTAPYSPGFGNRTSPTAAGLAPLAGLARGLLNQRDYDTQLREAMRRAGMEQERSDQYGRTIDLQERAAKRGDVDRERRDEAVTRLTGRLRGGDQLSPADLIEAQGAGVPTGNMSGLIPPEPYDSGTDPVHQRYLARDANERENQIGPYAPDANETGNGRLPSAMMSNPFSTARSLLGEMARTARDAMDDSFDVNTAYAEAVRQAFAQSMWGTKEAYMDYMQRTYNYRPVDPGPSGDGAGGDAVPPTGLPREHQPIGAEQMNDYILRMQRAGFDADTVSQMARQFYDGQSGERLNGSG